MTCAVYGFEAIEGTPPSGVFMALRGEGGSLSERVVASLKSGGIIRSSFDPNLRIIIQ
jgi:hypothetical protein